MSNSPSLLVHDRRGQLSGTGLCPSTGELSKGAGAAEVVRRGRRHSWMNIPFVLAEDAPLNKAQVMAKLEAQGIETRAIMAGNIAGSLVKHPTTHMIEHPVAPSLQVADQILNRGFMIGCHPGLGPDAVDLLLTTLASFKQL